MTTVKRTLLPSIGALICFWFALLATNVSHGADLQKARALYNDGKYIESIAHCPKNTEEGIYLMYLNEEEIGGIADYESSLPGNPKAKYRQYVKQNPKLFIYDESAGGTFDTSMVRHEQLKNLNPKSKYVGIIEFDGIKSLHYAVWEDGDGSSHSKELVSKYEKLIRRFPSASFVSDVKARIEKVKKDHKRVSGKEL